MKYLKFILLFSIVTGLKAQEDTLLTKERIVSEVLSGNFGISIANNNVSIAENNQGILNSGFLPSLTGVAGADYSRNNQSAGFQDGSIREIEGAETTRYNASLNLSYTLFDGLGRWYDYKILKEQYDLSQLDAREIIETTLLQLFTVYFEVARLSENDRVLRETFQNTKRRLIRAEYAFEYGQINKLDVLNAEVDIVSDSINIMNNVQLLKNAKRDLNMLANQPLGREFRVDTTVSFLNPMLIEEYLVVADTNNVRILQAQQNLAISDYNYKARKSIFLPSVGLTGSYGWNEGNFPATNFLASSSSTGISAGVNLTWNLFDGGSGITTLKNAKLQIANQDLLKDQLMLEVKRDIANATGNYKNRVAIFNLQEKNVVTAKNNFERSNEQYKLGQITSLELRQAQINLLNAQTNTNLAKYQAKLAELELLQLSGQLLNVVY